MRLRLLLAPAALAAGMALAATPAQASQMIAQNAKYISLRVGTLKGTEVALVTYYAEGTTHHVLLWGAINGAANPTAGAEAKFHVNYSGGYGTEWGMNAWKTLHNQRNLCSGEPPASQKVPMAVVECEVPGTGQYWALQTWRRLLPNMGAIPGSPVAVELHASHWNTPLPVLWLKWDWSSGGPGVLYDHLYGLMSYRGKAVYGTSNTATGNPLDAYGRNIYVDIQNSHWHGDGQGGNWYRFNSFLAHQGRGDFCATVYPHNPSLGAITQSQKVGQATQYRATAMGPGVTPIVRWQGSGPGANTSSPVYYPGGFAAGGWVDGLVDRLGNTSGSTSWKLLDDEQIAVAGGSGSSDKCAHVYGPH
jgi:hypothetical protein